jgi:hypothetical protein
VNPCDAIAGLFQIDNPDAAIARADSFFRWERWQLAGELHRVGGAELDEQTIAAIVGGIFDHNWTFGDMRKFLNLKALLPELTGAIFKMDNIDSPIARDEEVVNVERELITGLRGIFNGADISIPEAVINEIVQKITKEFMTGAGLCEYLVDFVFLRLQRPVFPAPAQATNIDGVFVENGYVRIYANPNSNCLFDAWGIALAAFGSSFPSGWEVLNGALAIMHELLIEGTTEYAQRVIGLVLDCERELGCRVLDKMLVRQAASAPADLQGRLGFVQHVLDGMVYSLKIDAAMPAMARDCDKQRDHLIRMLSMQLQLLCRIYLRMFLAKFPLPDPLPGALVNCLAATQRDIERDNKSRELKGLLPKPPARNMEEYRENYTKRTSQWGEVPDAIQVALASKFPVYVITQGMTGLVAFGPDGNPISNPDPSCIPSGAVIFWGDGRYAGDGTHWDVYIPRSMTVCGHVELWRNLTLLPGQA